MKQTGDSDKAERRLVGEIALAWWRATISDQEKARDRGARAQLKRCSDPTEVFFCPAFHKLLYSLHAEGWHNRDTAAVIAGVLAHVKENNGGARFAAQMAAGKDGNEKTAVVSELRFRRLLKCKTRADLYLPVIRVVRLMGGQADVADLAKSIWNWEHKDCFVQRDWACDYYEHAPEKKT